MSHRKASMTMADLAAIHENRTAISPPTARDENEEIFEEICQQVERDCGGADDDDCAPVSSQRRTCKDDDDISDPAQANKQQRRHSSYEPRTRRKHRERHSEFKEHFQTLDDRHAGRRASFVNNLLEFNLSLDVSMSSMSDVKSAAMHLSCPVLSYMNDEEEDSVELRLLKNPTMTYVGDDSLEQSWESLKDDTDTSTSTSTTLHGSSNDREQSREYVIELPPLDDLDESSMSHTSLGGSSTRPRRHKRHSYKILEQQLNEYSHLQVLKNFSSKPAIPLPSSSTVARLPSPAPSATSIKSLEQSDDFCHSHEAELPSPARAATARGA